MTPPHTAARCLLGLRPLARTPERRLNIVEVCGGLRSPPQAARKLRLFHFQPPGKEHGYWPPTGPGTPSLVRGMSAYISGSSTLGAAARWQLHCDRATALAYRCRLRAAGCAPHSPEVATRRGSHRLACCAGGPYTISAPTAIAMGAAAAMAGALLMRR